MAVAHGEAVAVMGPSGSGKSTLLNLIAGLDRPTSGSVRVGDERVDMLGETGAARFRRRWVGMIFQFFNLLDDMTVADNVLLPAQLGGQPKAQARARVDELLTTLRIGQHRDAYPARLSGGERQRVAIARALVNRPELLLADEPTGALDTATSEEIGELLLELNSSGQTLILVTHNPDLAARYARRVIELVDGRVASDGASPDRSGRTGGSGPAGRVGRTGVGQTGVGRTGARGRERDPAVRAARGGLAGRRVQAVVIGLVVLASTAASTLALGMLVDSSAPFDHAFTAQHGAQVAAQVDTARASAARLAATTRLPEVTAASGPFPETTVTAAVSTPGAAGVLQVPVTLTGRASPGGPVDDLTLTSGRWAQTTGEVVWASSGQASGLIQPGTQITLSGVPGSPRLTVVGTATSVTRTGQAWVLPAEIAALHGSGVAQMLYRFSSAGSSTAVSADVAAVRAALPPGALLGTQSYLTAEQKATVQIAPWVPFIVAFGVIALVMSVLIVVNVVSGAVVAGTRRIGVLKSIGFTPFQVVAAYVLQVAVPAVAGCAAGAVCGNLLATPLLSQNAQVYGVGALSVPLWVDVAVPLAMLGLTVVAALLPALRAGRMSAVQAIATGRAPRPSHGYLAHRLLGRVPAVPRAVTIGLAGPFARPARTFVTLAAILFGAVAVTFGVGLGTSLNRAQAELSLAQTEPVQVQLGGNGPQPAPGPGPGSGPVRRRSRPGRGVRRRRHGRPRHGRRQAAQQRAVVSALRAQPATLHYVPETDDQLSVPGLADPLSVVSFGGDASWTGYGVVTGRWYSGRGEADVNTYFLTATGTAVGEEYTLSSGGRQTTVRIVGEFFDPGSSAVMFMSSSALAAVAPGLTPQQYDVGVRPGTNVQAYANALSAALGPSFQVSVAVDNSKVFTAVLGLVAVLTVLLMVVAGLGVLNTVVLQIRERVHDLGVFKAVGMTPRQTVVMVVCSVTGVGILAGVIAIPAGVALHQYVVPVMGHGAQTNLPPSLLSVYRPWELVLLALSGLLIAVAGALAPAGWAARTRTAFALRAE